MWGSPVGPQLGSHSCPLLCRVSKGGDRKADWQPRNMTSGQAGVLKDSGVGLAESLPMASWTLFPPASWFVFRVLFLSFLPYCLSVSCCIHIFLFSRTSVTVCLLGLCPQLSGTGSHVFYFPTADNSGDQAYKASQDRTSCP